ncbi:hypothetical protein L3C95_15740 [Chitinophaga filiformis]|uniref:hypothetical protein n=1 Tax=Chitinophaga filiformis TaxID=104663 RepID=UPI001F2ACC19|nr:hypothetical protein [Chitinophaga filiformis]MCF6404349.1 hypothetical protein [Chitinophaga filiformis]
MIKTIRIPVFLWLACALATFFTSCSNAGLEDIIPKDSVQTNLLRDLYIDGKLAQRIDYDADKKIKSIYIYSLSDTATVNPGQRIDYEYNAAAQVIRELTYTLRDNKLATDGKVVYQADTILVYVNDQLRSHMGIIRPDKITHTGDKDTTLYPGLSLQTLDYSLYTMEGNDLTRFYNRKYFRNQYMEYDFHYEEVFSYDTTINPIWPIIENSPYFARAFLEIQYKGMRPFAFTVSKHNPIKVDIAHATLNLWYPKGVSFEYKYLPDFPYPVEQKCIDRSNGSVYATYKFEYLKVVK